MKKPDTSMDHDAVQKLREENQQLRSRLERLERQASALAQANAYAAELVAQLDEANDSLQRENDRRSLAEQRLQEVNAGIESEVQQRLNNLQAANEALLREVSEYKSEGHQPAQGLQQLEAANRELTEFAYVVSHDLKAPLRGIKTLAGWLAEDSRDRLGEEGKEQLDLLLGRIERMESLIEGILQYSRVGRASGQREAVDINQLLPNVIDMVAPPEDITITVQGPFPTLHCERTRITQIFQNLISNAVKYSDKSPGHVEIGCEDQDDRWVFHVSDNGMGIEKCHFDRIFKMFQTLVPQEEMESSGIGLALVRKAVGLYGGQVWVESTVGEGSTFFFSWPQHILTPTEIQNVGDLEKTAD